MEFLGISIYNTEDYILRKLLVLTFTLACMLLCHAQCQASDVNSVKATIVKHAIEMGVDPAIALSIARTESGFRHEARSSHGAVGVFQLMPSTARRMGYNPYLLNDNIKAGITYYKKMYNMFGSVELALAAYNAGPGNVQRYRAIPPYGETRRFVSKIMTDVNRQKHTPDPVVTKVRQGAYVAQKPKAVTLKPVAQTVHKPVAPKVIEAKELQAEVLEEKPIELKLETLSVAI